MALVLGGVVAGQRYGARRPVAPEPVGEPEPTPATRERVMCVWPEPAVRLSRR